MPLAGSSGRAWGALPLVVDTSAWARAHRPEVRERWKEALLARRLRISPVVRFEILLSARNGQGFDTLADLLEFESVWLAPAGTLP